MENSIKLIYWSVGAVIFVMALSILMYTNSIMEKEYRNILYTDKYAEVSRTFAK